VFHAECELTGGSVKAPHNRVGPQQGREDSRALGEVRHRCPGAHHKPSWEDKCKACHRERGPTQSSDQQAGTANLGELGCTVKPVTHPDVSAAKHREKLQKCNDRNANAAEEDPKHARDKRERQQKERNVVRTLGRVSIALENVIN
jgi:hypothetical protein